MVTKATANFKLNQNCYDIYFSQFYIPKKCEELSIRKIIILDVLAILSFGAFYRLNVSHIASYHKNGTSNISQTLSSDPNICNLSKTTVMIYSREN